jgi:hypothetical protein
VTGFGAGSAACRGAVVGRVAVVGVVVVVATEWVGAFGLVTLRGFAGATARGFTTLCRTAGRVWRIRFGAGAAVGPATAASV